MSGLLHHSPADIIRYILVAGSNGTMPSAGESWPINVSSEPDQPDNCITLYDTEGIDGGRTMNDGERQVHEGIQVKVRGTDHVVGFAKASLLASALDSIRAKVLTIDSTTYIVHCVIRTGGVLSLGKEVTASKRSLFTINATVSLRIKP